MIRTARQPIMIVPPLVFPLFLLAINASGLDAATNIPGFPTDSYLAFALAFPFMQGAIFATNTAGHQHRRGHRQRLLQPPLADPDARLLAARRPAHRRAAGRHDPGDRLPRRRPRRRRRHRGRARWACSVLFALSLSISAAFGTIGLFVGLRTGSGEAVQGLFPLMFILLFLSSATLPRDLIAQDWFQTVATINPVSYLIEGLRSLFITGWDAEALALAFGVAIAIFAVGARRLDASALRERLVRT